MADYFNIKQKPDSVNLILYPNGDDDVSMTSYGQTNHYECVDEIWSSPNNDTDYIYTSGISTVSDIFTVENHTTETETINYVRVISVAKSHYYRQSSSGTYKIYVDDGSSTVSSDNKAPLTTTYKKYYHTLSTKPSGGAWTWNDIDNMKIGIICSSPTMTYPNDLATFRPNGDGNYTQMGASGCDNDYECVDEETADDGTTYLTSNSANEKSTFTFPNHTTEVGTINNITCYARTMAQDENDKTFEFMLRIGGVDFYSSTINSTIDTWTTHSNAWTSNPSTSIAWTWTDIDNLEAGVRVDGDTYPTKDHRLTQFYVVVDYESEHNPEIRTTQEYAVVNYAPSVSIVSLSIPDRLSVSHGRDISRFNFPDGDYEIADMGRSGKELNISGIEYNSTVSDMQDVKDMCHYGSTVSLTGLPDNNLNTEYLIRNFSWEDMSYSNASNDRIYRWNLQLEEA